MDRAGHPHQARRAAGGRGSELSRRGACRPSDARSAGGAITITGRIDGLSVDKDAKSVTIEEVKSIHFDLELEALYRSEKLQRHLYQLLLYSYFLSSQPDFDGFTFAPQLVLIDLVSGEAKIIDTEFDRTASSSTLHASLAQAHRRPGDLVRAAHRQARVRRHAAVPVRRHARRAGGDRVGRGARHLAARCAARLRADRHRQDHGRALSGREAVAEAREETLFPHVEDAPAGRRGRRRCELLNDGSFRVLRIRAKQKMCAHTEMICHEDFCPFAAKYSEKMAERPAVEHLVTSMSYFDPDVTFELAKSTEVCPFEVSLELIEQADVIVCDYNYIFDPYVGLKAYHAGEATTAIACWSWTRRTTSSTAAAAGTRRSCTRSRSRTSAGRSMTRNCWIEGWEELLHVLARSLPRDRGSAGRRREAVALLAEPRAVPGAAHGVGAASSSSTSAGRSSNRIAEEDDPLIDFYFKLMKFTNMLAEKGDEFAHMVERTDDGHQVSRSSARTPPASSARSSSPRTRRSRSPPPSSRSSSTARPSAFPPIARPSSRCRRRSRAATARSW